MNFTEVSSNEIKQNLVGLYSVISNDFRFALVGSRSKVSILEMIPSTFSVQAFPYRIEYIELPQSYTNELIISNIDMRLIYAGSNILEKQEMSVDPMFATQFSEDAPKSHAVQITWAPKMESTLAVVTSCGRCEILQKSSMNRNWNDLRINVNESVLEMFSLDIIKLRESIKTFGQLKSVLENCCVTAFTWTDTELFYIANSSGWIVALTFNKSTKRIKGQYKALTDLGKITYLKKFDDFLLASGSNGAIKLFDLSNFNTTANITQETTQSILKENECLWSGIDDISIGKIQIDFNKILKQYTVVFTKGSFLFTFLLSWKGKVTASSNLYVGHMRITGLEILRNDEYIITTSGDVKIIRLHHVPAEELKISVHSVQSYFDGLNYQILGLISSPNKFLWSFIHFRNKEYTHQAKYTSNCVFVSVCKLSSQNAFEFLFNTTISRLDPYLDCTEAVRLEILNNITSEKYYEFSAFAGSWDFDECLLRKLQLRLLIVNSILRYQKYKFKNMQAKFMSELQFVYRLIQIVHIACRLKYLNSISSPLSAFQLLAGKCLRAKFFDIEKKIELQDNCDTNTRNKLLNKLSCTTRKFHTIYDKIEEHCKYCSMQVNSETMVCADNHKVPRCCLSNVQVPTFCKRYCSECNTVTLDDDFQLTTLMGTEDIICIFCRFSFKEMESV